MDRSSTHDSTFNGAPAQPAASNGEGRAGPAAGGFDAVILAGGRSSRLGGTAKALLRAPDGRTLLRTALDAARAASSTVVAGPAELAAEIPGAAVLVREDPPFSGPAAAVGAAVAHLADSGSDAAWTLVLACDMPHVQGAVDALLQAAADSPGEYSLLAVDDSGRQQPLAALYRSAALRSAVGAVDRPGGLENQSMKRLLARVQWRGVPVPRHATADVDTWIDARNLGVSQGESADSQPEQGFSGYEGVGMASQEETLEAWSRRLLNVLELEGTDVNVGAVLKLAAVAAHTVVRPAAPLTTFIAGYAAGLAAGTGQADGEVAMRAAIAAAARECETLKDASGEVTNDR